MNILVMNPNDFQNGDYIKYQSNRVLKITDAVNMQAEDENGAKLSYSNGCCPNIGLDDEVLRVIGFTKNNGVWRRREGQYLIKYDDNRAECSISLNAQVLRNKSLSVLSALQDFVRDYTGKELPINHQTLAEYIRNL